ncbi:MAG: thiamine ABC transporter substrate-binding protein [Desulfosarcinaceae bacterium]|nr:thiamine ABC transporter substrate-binding protein [Desulfosarcinaceae bacterium]
MMPTPSYKTFLLPLCFLLLLTVQRLPAAPVELVVMSHDSFNVNKRLVAEFETAHNAKIRFLKAGDTGAALNKAILSKNNPLADVFYGVDNTFLSRALAADIFLPYPSPKLDHIPAALRLDPQHRLLPVDFGDVCLNYHKAWFKERDLAPPSRLEDLIKPAYKGLTVVQNPATSSPGLAFLLTTVAHFGDPNYLEFWKQLRANDVLVTDGWESAYWGHFSAASKGDRPIVVSYASSPSAEVHFAETPLTEAPTAALIAPGSVFRQIEFVGILKGTQRRRLAEKWIDTMLDRPFQEEIPLTMFVYPSNATARLPEVFVKHSQLADAPVELSPDAIAKGREAWIEAWTSAVLR